MVECDCGMGLGWLSSPQGHVVFSMLLSYIEAESPGLISFEMRRDFGQLEWSLQEQPNRADILFILFTICSGCSD